MAGALPGLAHDVAGDAASTRGDQPEDDHQEDDDFHVLLLLRMVFFTLRQSTGSLTCLHRTGTRASEMHSWAARRRFARPGRRSVTISLPRQDFWDRVSVSSG